jgi:hypothetical protein
MHIILFFAAQFYMYAFFYCIQITTVNSVQQSCMDVHNANVFCNTIQPTAVDIAMLMYFATQVCVYYYVYAQFLK